MPSTVPKPDTPAHVVAGVIRNRDGAILLALRPQHLREGGLWEFPGGKREPGETRAAALVRELAEELDIEVIRATPLIQVPWEYPYLRLLLDVWVVDEWRGTPHGREGQELRWVRPEQLADYAFPAANHSVVTAAGLPRLYAITAEPTAGIAAFLDRVRVLVDSGIRLLQLRVKSLPTVELGALIEHAGRLADAAGTLLLVNAAPALALQAGARGVHLGSAQLMQLNARPVGPQIRLAASCHNSIELEQAMRIGADFVVLGPVRATASHPGARLLGWHGLIRLIRGTGLPVFALGGMQIGDLRSAVRGGCQGIAAIRSVWDAQDVAAVVRAADAVTAAAGAQIPQH